MVQKKRQRLRAQTKDHQDFRSRMRSPVVQESLRELRSRYGGHAASVSEVRAMLDKAMGERTLKEELCRLREE